MNPFYLMELPESINASILPQSYLLHNAAILQDVSHILALRAGQSCVYIPAVASNFFSSPSHPDWHVCSTRMPSWSGHGNVICVFIPRRYQFLRLYGVGDEWINKCQGFVECSWQRKSEVYLLGYRPTPLPLCPSQVPHGLTCDRTPASAMRMKRLR